MDKVAKQCARCKGEFYVTPSQAAHRPWKFCSRACAVQTSSAEAVSRHSQVDAETGCIEWTGYRNPGGYGMLTHAKKLQLAHRLAWISVHGDIPEDMCICHKCDNRGCVNVDHLFIGTHRDNMDDRGNKGRHGYAFGEASHLAKISENDVIEIRTSKESASTLADRFGVSPDNIGKIRAGLTWKHITQEFMEKKKRDVGRSG